MRIPSPLDATAWPVGARLVGWAALAGAAAVAIAGGVAVVAGIVQAQSGLIAALIGGWLLSVLVGAPVEALVRRGWPRQLAVAAAWLAVAAPALLLVGELLFAFATTLGELVAGPSPTTAEIARLVERPTALLASFGVRVDLVPLAGDLVATLRTLAAEVGSNLGGIAAGALSALGPVILAIGTGIALTANPTLLDRPLDLITPVASEARVHRSRLLLEAILVRFIGRHLLLGALYGLAVFPAASLAGADGLLAAVLGGLVMAIPTLGQGAAILPPLLLVLLAAGPSPLPAILLIVVAWLLCATQVAPRLFNGVLHLSGTTVFIAGSVGGLVAGPLGAIFALPLVAAAAAIGRAERSERPRPGSRPRVARRRRT